MRDELPAGWTSEPLANLGAWIGGGTPSKARSDFWIGGTIPWLTPKDMKSGTILATRDRMTSAAVYGSTARLIEPPSLAIVVRSGILEHSLPVAVVQVAVTLNQDMKALRPRSGLHPQFLRYALEAEASEILRSCRTQGTTVASLDTRRLMAWQVPLAPLDEQHRICAVLEERLSRLGAAEDYLTAAAARTDSWRTSVLAECWASLARMGCVELRSVGKVVTGATPRGIQAHAEDEGGFRFFTPGDLGQGGVLLHSQRYLPADLASGTRIVAGAAALCVCIGATVGKTGWVEGPFATNQQINAVETGDAGTAAVLTHLMGAPQFQRQLRAAATTTTMPLVNKGRFQTLLVPVPDPVQRERLEAVDAAVKRLQDDVGRLRQQARTLRHAVLRSAFAGQL